MLVLIPIVNYLLVCCMFFNMRTHLPYWQLICSMLPTSRTKITDFNSFVFFMYILVAQTEGHAGAMLGSWGFTAHA